MSQPLAQSVAAALARAHHEDIVAFRSAADALYRGKPEEDRRLLAQQGILALVTGSREERMRQAAIVALQTADLLEVAGVLRAGEVPFVVLKGVPLARRFYDLPGDRLSGDIDLAVPAAQHRSLMRVLLRAGFEHHPSEYAAGSVETFVCGHHRTVLEVHFRVSTAERIGTLFEELLDAPGELVVEGQALPVPRDVPNLLYLCVHLARHMAAPRVIWVEDLRRWVAFAGHELDWRAFVADADRHGAANAVSLAAALVDAATGAPLLPREVMMAIERQRTSSGRLLYDWLLPRLLAPERSALVVRAHSVGLSERWQDRVQLGVEFVRRRVLRRARRTSAPR